MVKNSKHLNTMKRFVILLALLVCSTLSYSQLVARVEMKENLEGICDNKNVYTLFPMFGDQVEAVCSVPDTAIQASLNEIVFLKDKPKHKDKGMVSIFINCKGQVAKCAIDNKSSSPELDEQILAVFKTLTTFKAGKLNG